MTHCEYRHFDFGLNIEICKSCQAPATYQCAGGCILTGAVRKCKDCGIDACTACGTTDVFIAYPNEPVNFNGVQVSARCKKCAKD
jgi:hypothetical protein